MRALPLVVGTKLAHPTDGHRRFYHHQSVSILSYCYHRLIAPPAWMCDLCTQPTKSGTRVCSCSWASGLAWIFTSFPVSGFPSCPVGKFWFHREWVCWGYGSWTLLSLSRASLGVLFVHLGSSPDKTGTHRRRRRRHCLLIVTRSVWLLCCTMSPNIQTTTRGTLLGPTRWRVTHLARSTFRNRMSWYDSTSGTL